jgi:hypothetical membrane protein
MKSCLLSEEIAILKSRLNYLNAAGALLFIGVLQWFLIVIAAETLFPGYTTRANDLSDLASTVWPNMSLVQPSAMMFNATMLLLGLTLLISASLIYYATEKRLFTTLLAITGLAAMAVGVFPGDTGTIHGLVAMVCFVTAPLSAIAAYRLVNRPLGYFSVVIGVFSLIALFSAVFLGESSPFLAFGRGGEERAVAYPVLLWMIGFGGYLMGSPQINVE